MTLERVSDFSGGPIKIPARVEITSTGTSSRFVTAVVDDVDGERELKLTSWRVTDNSEVDKHLTQFVHSVTEVSLVSLSSNRVLTAIRDGQGKLRISVWDLSDLGHFLLKGEASGETLGMVSKIDACRAGSTHRVVTAVRDASGHLKLVVWEVDDTGHVSFESAFSSGQAEDVAICSLGDEQVFVAIRTGEGKLRASAYLVQPSGNIIPQDSIDAGAVQSVKVAPLNLSILAAMRINNGKKKVIVFETDNLGHITRVADATGASSTGIVAGATKSKWLTAARDIDGKLKLSAWSIINPLGTAALTSDEDGAGTFSNLALTGLKDLPNPPSNMKVERLAVAGRDSHGNLKIIIWHYPIQTVV